MRRDDGSVAAFEIPPSFFTQWPLTRLLRSIQGVSEVEAPWLSKNTRFRFKFRGEPCVVLDESDRYWIGPASPSASTLDLAPVHEAFRAHRQTVLRRWATGFDTSNAPEMSSSVLVATLACLGYFWLVDLLPRDLLAPAPVVGLVIAVPIVLSGLLHYLVARNHAVSKLRLWAQIVGTAILAPLLAWFLAFAFGG
jgi:hypothetical protein